MNDKQKFLRKDQNGNQNETLNLSTKIQDNSDGEITRNAYSLHLIFYSCCTSQKLYSSFHIHG